MRIDHLALRNFRCFDEREFDFHPRMNVVIGENGSGKTAILEALAVAAGSWLLGIRDYNGRNIQAKDVRHVEYERGEAITFERQYPVEVTANGEVGGDNILWKRILNGKQGKTTHGDANSIKKIADKADSIVRSGGIITLPLIVYYGAGRLWKKISDKVNKRTITKDELSRFEGYRDSMDDRVDVRDLMNWIEYQDRITRQEGKKPILYEMTLNAMELMLNVHDVYFDARRLELIAHWENHAQPYDNLSDGQRNIIAMAGDIAMRMARLNPHLGLDAIKAPGIALIDELDLHLHPNWQRRIVDDLRRTFPNLQFITTTHSPFIIQTLGEGELINLEGKPVLNLGKLDIETIAKGLMNVSGANHLSAGTLAVHLEEKPDLMKLGIEIIALGQMGVNDPDVSLRYREMVEIAKEYLKTLSEAGNATEETRRDIRRRLDEIMSRYTDRISKYADNPAFQAYLEMKRAVKLGE